MLGKLTQIFKSADPIAICFVRVNPDRGPYRWKALCDSHRFGAALKIDAHRQDVVDTSLASSRDNLRNVGEQRRIAEVRVRISEDRHRSQSEGRVAGAGRRREHHEESDPTSARADHTF